MNANRRKALQAIIDTITEANEKLTDLMNEEQEYFDNMPEGLQAGERGERAEEAISNLEDAIGELESAVENIETSIE